MLGNPSLIFQYSTVLVVGHGHVRGMMTGEPYGYLYGYIPYLFAANRMRPPLICACLFRHLAIFAKYVGARMHYGSKF